MLIYTGCTLILQNILSPVGRANYSTFAFLQYDFDPVSTIEFMAYRIPHTGVYSTFLCTCGGKTIHDGLLALLKSVKNLSEEMRKNPPVELLVGVIRRIYDSSVNLAEVFYSNFDYISSMIPLSRISVHKDKYLINLVLIDPFIDELLRVDEQLEISQHMNVRDRIEDVRRYLVKLYAEHDKMPEIPSLASYLRYLAARLGLVGVNVEKRTITVAGVELVPPSESDFEKAIEALGLHMHYYSANQVVEIAYRKAVFRKTRIKANIVHTGSGVRILVHPESLARLLREDETCPSLYMLIKTVKREQRIEADVYILYVHGDMYTDAARVLTVDVTKCNGNIPCIIKEVSNAARKHKPLVTAFRLMRSLLKRGYNIRLIYTKGYSLGSNRYVDVVEVRATKISDDSLYLISYFNDPDSGFSLYATISNPNYTLGKHYFDEVRSLIEKVESRFRNMRSNRYETLHGFEIEIPLRTPRQVEVALDYIEESYRSYMKLVTGKRLRVESFDKRDAVLIYLATLSAMHYGPYKSFNDAYSATMKQTDLPFGLLITLCNNYLANVGASINDIYRDVDTVLARLFEAGLVELDDSGSFRVLGLPVQHVIERYTVPTKPEWFDMLVLKSLLRRSEGLREITGGKIPMRIIELLISLGLAANSDKSVVVKGLLDVVGDAELWYSLPEEYQASVIRIGGRELVIRAAIDGYYWVLSGHMDMLLPMLNTPSEKTLVIAATRKLSRGYSIYEHGGQYYLRYKNIVLQICDVSLDGIFFRGSIIGYPVGIAFTAGGIEEAVEKIASDLLDAYTEFRELLEELSETKQNNIRVEYEDAGLFKVPVIIVNKPESTTRLYLDKGIKDMVFNISATNILRQ